MTPGRRIPSYSGSEKRKVVPLHVPSLAKKLQCLYQRHERVDARELLAEHLGIAPNNSSIWINGNEVGARELVPSFYPCNGWRSTR